MNQKSLTTEESQCKCTELVRKQKTFTFNVRNACEVDVSITAPYWATNTRNDSLALLNLYPFEQYIHMEICKAEHDEMLCRPGCRYVGMYEWSVFTFHNPQV